MDDEERYIVMKKRIINSYKWQKDVIIPLANDFGITVDEMNDIFMNSMDMSSLEAMHGTYDVAEQLCLQKRIWVDLKLCWFSETLEFVSHDEATEIVEEVSNEINNGKSYDDALKDGKDKILKLLRGVQC